MRTVHQISHQGLACTHGMLLTRLWHSRGTPVACVQVIMRGIISSGLIEATLRAGQEEHARQELERLKALGNVTGAQGGGLGVARGGLGRAFSGAPLGS